MDAKFVGCPGCHAEISDDRETCPHCGAEIVSVVETQLKQAENEDLRRLTQQVVLLDQSNGVLKDQVARLVRENAELHEQNTELRKRVAPVSAVVLKDQVARLVRENAELHAQNTELRKQVAPVSVVIPTVVTPVVPPAVPTVVTPVTPVTEGAQ